MNKVTFDNKFSELLKKKEIRCRHCDSIIEPFEFGCDCCNTECDIDDKYIVYNNGHIINLYDAIMEYSKDKNLESLRAFDYDFRDLDKDMLDVANNRKYLFNKYGVKYGIDKEMNDEYPSFLLYNKDKMKNKFIVEETIIKNRRDGKIDRWESIPYQFVGNIFNKVEEYTDLLKKDWNGNCDEIMNYSFEFRNRYDDHNFFIKDHLAEVKENLDEGYLCNVELIDTIKADKFSNGNEVIIKVYKIIDKNKFSFKIR